MEIVFTGPEKNGMPLPCAIIRVWKAHSWNYRAFPSIPSHSSSVALQFFVLYSICRTQNWAFWMPSYIYCDWKIPWILCTYTTRARWVCVCVCVYLFCSPLFLVHNFIRLWVRLHSHHFSYKCILRKSTIYPSQSYYIMVYENYSV